jgi:gliding motility-associated-like protein
MPQPDLNFISRIVPNNFLLLAVMVVFYSNTQGQNLVAFYPFNGNANDASGNNHHGQLINGVQLTSDRFGNPNSAYYFDGSDDYIKVTDNGAFSTPHFSLGIWFKTQSNALQNLVGKRDFLTSAGSGGSQYQFFINYPPFPGIGSNIVSNNASCTDAWTSSYVSTGNVICSNKWYFAVVTFDGSRHKIYIDGVLVRDIPTSFNGMLPCNSDLRFGNWWGLDLITFKGAMDDICWYSRAINQQEVDSIFNNFQSPTSPVDFTYSQDACDIRKISFTNNTSGIQSCVWHFGDATTTSSVNPVHTYPAYGSFTVKLITTNTAGCTDSVSKPVLVNMTYSDIIVNRDTSICSGESVQLNVLPGSDFCWPVTQYLNSPSITNPIATPTQNVTYYFNSKQTGANVVTNGNFSNGNSGFASEYNFSTSNGTEGHYSVGSNPAAWNGTMSPCTDHTGGNGNMMIVNGSPIASTKVWCQTVSLNPGTVYEFSAWVQSVFASNPAQLQFSINGVQVGQIFNAGAVCSWQRFFATWSSGIATAATICIENKNTIVMGNDFALDDISLAPVFLRHDSVRITVVPAPNVTAGDDAGICMGQSTQLNGSGATNLSWTPATSLSDPNIPNPFASPTTTTQYIVSGYNDPACVKKDTVVVMVSPLPVLGISPSTQNVCSGNNFTITASGGNSYNWFNSTQNNLSASNQLSLLPQTSDTYFVAVTDSICNVNDTLSAVVNIMLPPAITISKSNDIDCAIPQARLTATGGDSYSWSPVSDINNTSISNPVVYPDKDTWFRVVVTNNAGCSSADSIFVKSDLTKGKAEFFVPNAFTPNQDGLNDCFGLAYWTTTSDFELSVYNRWGQLVFYTKDKMKCWDGIFKGVKQPGGVFVYQVKANSPCSKEPLYRKGTLVLIR